MYFTVSNVTRVGLHGPVGAYQAVQTEPKIMHKVVTRCLYQNDPYACTGGGGRAYTHPRHYRPFVLTLH